MSVFIERPRALLLCCVVVGVSLAACGGGSDRGSLIRVVPNPLLEDHVDTDDRADGEQARPDAGAGRADTPG